MTNTVGCFEYNRYFFGDKHICREERQYALFLYNIFLKKLYIDKEVGNLELSDEEKDIIKNCLDIQEINGLKIINVFYEFSAMRDLFAKAENRVEFNEKLIVSVFASRGTENAEAAIAALKECRNKNNSNNCSLYDNLGHLNMSRFKDGLQKLSDDALKTIYLIRCMMNAKADIVVLYKSGSDNNKATALECKYKSGEGKYKDLHDINKKIDALRQTEVQTAVLEYLFADFVKEKCTSKIVHFVDNAQDKNDDDKENKIVIEIGNLGRLE